MSMLGQCNRVLARYTPRSLIQQLQQVGTMARRSISDSWRSREVDKLPLFDERSMHSDVESEAGSDATLNDNDSVLPKPSSVQYFETFQPYIRVCRMQSWRTTVGRIAFALLPSFVQSRIRQDEDVRPKQAYPTAYLDGMRGLAALFVFFCHFSYGCFNITKGWGYEWEDGTVNNYFLQLPILRLLYCGPPMVCIFFVISGYALSLKPLRLMRAHSWSELTTTLTSSIFRRGMRLFIPCFISTFIVVLLVQLGFYDRTRQFAASQHYFPAIEELHMWRAQTFMDQFYDWSGHVFQFVHVWSFEQFGGSMEYDLHLWTIPLEFRASMVLFLLQMGLARVRIWVRWTCLFVFSWFSLRNQRWEMVLFVSGMLLAELDLIRIARRGAQSNSRSYLHPASALSQFSETISFPEKAGNTIKNSASRQYLWISVAVCALYLMSAPDEDAADTPGFQFLANRVPNFLEDKYRFWQGLGSILFVLATNFCPALQRPFNTAFAQYFGRISYAIYLMHGPVLHTVGYMIMRWSWSITGSTTEGQYVLGFAVSTLFVVPVVVWAADLFCRFVDEPVVQFAKWVETKCMVGKEGKQ